MNLPLYALLVLLLAASLILIELVRRMQRSLAELKETKEAIESGEQRLFAFLHGLGAALQSDYTASNMQRYVVRGVVRVLEASGAGLYLLNDDRTRLVPAFISEGCPPLIALPEPVASVSGTKPSAVTSYVRLQSIATTHPLYRLPMEGQKPLRIADLATDPAFKGSATTLHEGVAIMAVPLIYADEPMGLLIVARESPGAPFNLNDQDLFESLADQSSFALGSAQVHKDAHDKQLLDNELRTASEFQRILLPASAPDFSPFHIAGANYPAKIVSGDYYDYVGVDENHLGVAIADVSGKGVPASLIMATCRSVLRAKAANTTAPSEVLKGVNELIFPDIREDMFVSMAYLIFDRHSDAVSLSRAGHNPPLHYRHSDREIVPLEPAGMAVGIDSGGVFERVTRDFEFQFSAGDLILLYTDGVTEAVSSEGLEFGDEGLREEFGRHLDLSPGEIVDRISARLKAFIGDQEQMDDITLIAIKKD